MANKRSSSPKKSTVKTGKKPAAQPTTKTNPATDDTFVLPTRTHVSLARKLIYFSIGLVILFGLTTVSLRVAYADRLYPGVWGHGTYVGGLSKQAAIAALTQETAAYAKQPILMQTESKTVTLKPADLSLSYDNTGLVDDLMQLGRDGNTFEQVVTQWSLLLGVSEREQAKLTFNDDTLATQAIALNAELASPSVNARYEAKDGTISFVNGQAGARLDFAALGLNFYDNAANLRDEPVKAGMVTVDPAVDNTTLEANKELAQSYIAKPLRLTYADKTWVVEPTTTLSWLHSTRSPEAAVYARNIVTEAYPALETTTNLDFDNGAIDSFLTTISKEIDSAAVDAQLNVTDGRATIFVASRDGRKLEVPKTRDAILASLKSTEAERSVAMNVAILKPTVNEESINNLGIKELLSEGASYFPGSSANRLTNVRVGAARYNGVLLKPGEVFSFGRLLGPVGAEQGYKKSLIILEDREVEDYGGGLCQVSSTAFRAALMAGLPILERTNHAFAISYYTAPYGVPGVDATIYYPPVDFKFRNDTDAHILIQTEMVGTTLKFRFYGTKKKEGVIRGPFFVTGDSDVNKPSHTVFYRDVLVGGQVTKTDTFNTYYKSALDYPVAPE